MIKKGSYVLVIKITTDTCDGIYADTIGLIFKIKTISTENHGAGDENIYFAGWDTATAQNLCYLEEELVDLNTLVKRPGRLTKKDKSLLKMLYPQYKG